MLARALTFLMALASKNRRCVLPTRASVLLIGLASLTQ